MHQGPAKSPKSNIKFLDWKADHGFWFDPARQQYKKSFTLEQYLYKGLHLAGPYFLLLTGQPEKEDMKLDVKIKKKSAFREYAEAAAIAVLLALFIRTFVVQAFKIPSGSMKPTLLIGDHLLVNKFIYGIKIPFVDRYLVHFKRPMRGDIVVFKYPEDERLDFIKRVIGIEGDKIQIRGDVLYINGKKIETRYVGEYRDRGYFYADEYEEDLDGVRHYILDEPEKEDLSDFGPVTVPPYSIFVMGDNRDNSKDSRYWGYVSLNKIKGKALIIYWSWPHWKRFFNLIR